MKSSNTNVKPQKATCVSEFTDCESDVEETSNKTSHKPSSMAPIVPNVVTSSSSSPRTHSTDNSAPLPMHFQGAGGPDYLQPSGSEQQAHEVKREPELVPKPQSTPSVVSLPMQATESAPTVAPTVSGSASVPVKASVPAPISGLGEPEEAPTMKSGGVNAAEVPKSVSCQQRKSGRESKKPVIFEAYNTPDIKMIAMNGGLPNTQASDGAWVQVQVHKNQKGTRGQGS